MRKNRAVARSRVLSCEADRFWAIIPPGRPGDRTKESSGVGMGGVFPRVSSLAARFFLFALRRAGGRAAAGAFPGGTIGPGWERTEPASDGLWVSGFVKVGGIRAILHRVVFFFGKTINSPGGRARPKASGGWTFTWKMDPATRDPQRSLENVGHQPQNWSGGRPRTLVGKPVGLGPHLLRVRGATQGVPFGRHRTKSSKPGPS